jgi:hypothetical protein
MLAGDASSRRLEAILSISGRHQREAVREILSVE